MTSCRVALKVDRAAAKAPGGAHSCSLACSCFEASSLLAFAAVPAVANDAPLEACI